MRLRKVLLWTGGGFAGLLALAFAALVYWAWTIDERFDTTIVIENRSGQPIHDLSIAHNGEVVYRARGLGPHEGLALAHLNPFKGPNAQRRRGDVYDLQAHAEIVFLRESGGPEQRHQIDVGGHSDHVRYECLFSVSITPQTVDATKCIEITLPKIQTKPEN